MDEIFIDAENESEQILHLAHMREITHDLHEKLEAETRLLMTKSIRSSHNRAATRTKKALGFRNESLVYNANAETESQAPNYEELVAALESAERQLHELEHHLREFSPFESVREKAWERVDEAVSLLIKNSPMAIKEVHSHLYGFSAVAAAPEGDGTLTAVFEHSSIELPRVLKIQDLIDEGGKLNPAGEEILQRMNMILGPSKWEQHKTSEAPAEAEPQLV